ncbi:uncharacterized protein LOC142802828 [Rhipicephalus microplus]|uniref:uncharacterized protein LOC142802828 n=1 Tax=Rhipicephalus microplus TaxID=6941 RepID=UPI003F6C7626
MIIAEAFGVLRAFRRLQEDLEKSNPIQQPNRGFLVASYYIWPKADDTPPAVFTENIQKFPLDAVIILTHMTFDEFEAKLPCAITAAAPYKLLDVVNILDMRTVMTKMSKQVPWVMRTTLTISTSFCTRVYLAKRFAYLDQECIDYLNRPNGTAAYCKLRKEFADIPFGLSIFDLECEDWGNTCTSQPDLPIAGTKRFAEVTDYYVTASNWSKDNFPCDYEK